jgi:hypothetical protein
VTRTFASTETREGNWQDVTNEKGVTTRLLSAPNDVYRHVDYASDVTKRPPGKWRPPTNYSRSVEQGAVCPFVSFSAWQMRYKSNHKLYRNFEGRFYDSGCPLDAALPSYNPVFRDRAITKALAQLKSQKVNLAVAFGERKRTAEMITDSVVKIRKAVRSARRLDFSNSLRHLAGVKEKSRSRRAKLRPADDREVSSGWLEIQYGWKPLLSDVHGACEELRRNDERHPERYTCSVKGSASSGRQVSYEYRPQITWPNGQGIRWKCHRRTRSRESAFVRLDYVLANPTLATLAQVGITNPLEVAWELVPFSFVADWFIPVGSYLGSLDAALGWDFLGGSVTQVSKRTRAGRAFLLDFPINSSHYAVPGSFNSEWASHYRAKMDRTTYSSSPIPGLPRLEKDPVRGLRLANAIALLGQAFR